MNCNKFQEQISLLIDNKLSLEEVKELMKHLESCSNCKQLHDDFVKVKKVLSTKPKINISDNFTDSVMNQIYKTEHKKKDNNIIHINIKKYFVFAASFLFIVSASVFFVMQQTKSNINSSLLDSESIFETYDNQVDYVYDNDVTAFLSMY
jgi:CO dehydrogenase/acetyl-CoA synthase beta subunit